MNMQINMRIVSGVNRGLGGWGLPIQSNVDTPLHWQPQVGGVRSSSLDGVRLEHCVGASQISRRLHRYFSHVNGPTVAAKKAHKKETRTHFERDPSLHLISCSEGVYLRYI